MTHEQPPTPSGDNRAGQLPPEAATGPAASQLPDAEQNEDQADDQPRIWAGSLADYNSGRLYGGSTPPASPTRSRPTSPTCWRARRGRPAPVSRLRNGVSSTTTTSGLAGSAKHERLKWARRHGSRRTRASSDSCGTSSS